MGKTRKGTRPELEPWETIHIPDGTILTLPEEPDLVFRILRASSQVDAPRPQGKFIYEIENIEGDYIGRCTMGGSELPTNKEEALELIGITYKRYLPSD